MENRTTDFCNKDETRNELSATFKSSCFSAKHFVEHFLEITGNHKGTSSPMVRNAKSTEETDLSDSATDKTTIPVNSAQSSTKRKAVATPIKCQPVPNKVTRAANEKSNEAEDNNSPNIDVLEEINKYAVPAKTNH